MHLDRPETKGGRIHSILKFALRVIFLLIGGLLAIVPFLPGLLPVPEAQSALALGGVTQNANWEPVIRRIAGFNMALVPSGCFTMGSTDEQLEEALNSCNRYYGAFGCQQSFESEQPAHEVCLTKPFWIDVTAVTNRQYGSSSSLKSETSPYRGPNWPRESVTWQEAVDFCAQRGARLPTEAEWEYAARGPDALIYPFGNQYDIHKVTLYKLNPTDVGKKPEGASWVGTLDTSGGIAEYVSDWYGPYLSEPQTDPTGPASGELRIARGGSWFAHAAYFVRTSFREPLSPDFSTSVVGFRCVRDFAP